MMGPGWGGMYDPYPYPGADPWAFEEMEYQNEIGAAPGDYRDAANAKKKLLDEALRTNRLDRFFTTHIAWDLFTHSRPRFIINVEPGTKATVDMPNGKRVELNEGQTLKLLDKLGSELSGAYGFTVYVSNSAGGPSLGY